MIEASPTKQKLDEFRVSLPPGDERAAYAADKVRGLNELISSIADVINLSGHNPVMLLDLGTVLRPEHFDGTDIHPNEAGYRAMAAAVMDVIARM